ncbi:hypothetical protein HUK80_00635 [Flavobacterium sp. MAH-1]|uniref:Uncharacterized protein n=1 Tax=Flavobacterium agri TaxID=2743471 RepID=A0A7Y9C5I7_9FLAO|nr:DUF6452 family protein [Flavobacterium agri]NUY79384.1 hypothetical protein [Flavobacterium agri]NYA69408.1 hypothetical protein [Flavobacterium agri]
MKRIFCCCLVVLFAVFQVNCERDDVCGGSTPTTPRIVVEFYDYNNTTLAKNVTNMTLKSTETDSVLTYTATNKVFVPLKTFDTTTTYAFTINDDENPNTLTFTDSLMFNYATRDVYVSRACGYKTVFDLSQDIGIPAVILNNGNPGTWIRNIVIDTHTIEFEDETHIRIYF